MIASYEFLRALANAKNKWAEEVNKSDDFVWSTDWVASDIALGIVTSNHDYIKKFAKSANPYLFEV
jgi:cellulose synthase/poly-beta-1,6-N-acetylglucosamine synthase-like glycosyltransferase